MKIIFAEEAWEDYIYWQESDKKTLKRINDLIKAITRVPYEGIGDRLLKNLIGVAFGRRISREHRLIYMVENDAVLVLSVGIIIEIKKTRILHD